MTEPIYLFILLLPLIPKVSAYQFGNPRMHGNLRERNRDLDESSGFLNDVEEDDVQYHGNAEELFVAGLSMLSSSRSQRLKGWETLVQAASLGHQNAKIKIAWAKMVGTYFNQDLDSAKEIFIDLAKLGNPNAQMGLGFLYATGTLTASCQARALLYYTFAALGGSDWALMAMGYRYWSGIGVASSCEKALVYYRRVAKNVVDQVSFSGGHTIQKVRLQDELESGSYSSGVLDSDLIEYYQLLAEKGDLQAQVGLGQLHYQGGRGIDTDHQMALKYFIEAANSGNAIALAFLGKMYLEGSDAVEQNNETAFYYFKKAADLGSPAGQSGLGLMYLHGRGVLKDYQKAYEYFKKSSDQNWVEGHLELGKMYYKGTGVSRDYKMATKYFQLASQSGNILAFFNLAEMHSSGTGVLRSCSTAVELFKNVAERGKWGDMMMEALLDYRKERYNEALMKYLILAELGYEVAQSNAAFIFEQGVVDTFQKTELLQRAFVYWTRAAAQGYSAARVRLGDYFFYGFGTVQDYETAALHYQIASEQQNNGQATFNLAYMHELGFGLKQDYHLAKRFYDMAADLNSDARVPVALALMKMHLITAIKNCIEFKTAIIPPVMVSFERYGDLYIITIMLSLLILILIQRLNHIRNFGFRRQ